MTQTLKRLAYLSVVATVFVVFPSISLAVDVDCGLKIRDGVQTQIIACESGVATSPLRVSKNNITYGITLVPITDTNASKAHIKTSLGLKALKKFNAIDPTQITDCMMLQNMRNDLTLSYQLMNDIDCSATNPANVANAGSMWDQNIVNDATHVGFGGTGFKPVGSDTVTTKFTGSFDGNGHTISNLYIYRPTTNYVGLFGYITPGANPAEVKNVGLIGVNITGNSLVGGLVGDSYAGASITSSYSTGSVTGNSYVGGLVGYNYAGSSITSSYSTSSVTGSSTGSHVGGLVGYNYYGPITSSYSTSSVAGNSHVGGLVGLNYSASIISSYSTGSITVSSVGSNTGGLVGYNNVGSINSSYATGNVTGSSNIGGLVGYNYTGSSITSSNSTGSVVGSVTGSAYVGGLVGYNSAPITSSNSTGNVTGSAYVGGLVGYNSAPITSSYYATGSVLGSVGSAYVGGLVGWNNFTTITSSYSTGSVTGSAYVGGLAGYNVSLTPITFSYSTGSVTGNSYVGGLVGENSIDSITSSYFNTTTSGQTVGCSSGPCTGVTGKTSTQMTQEATYPGWTFAPTASNVWKLTTVIPSGNYYPCLAWQDDATCQQRPPLNPISSCVGLQNMKNNLALEYELVSDVDCSATNPANPGNTASMWNNGGLGFAPIGNDVTPFAGKLNGHGYTISNLYIRRISTYYVGLLGYTNGADIKNVKLTGADITGAWQTGGLVGHNQATPISTSSFSGSVYGWSSVGGIAGRNMSSSPITSSYSSGSISGGSSLGGLVGDNYSSPISSSYTTGSISGSSSLGGLVGDNFSSPISSSYSTVSILGTSSVGGLIGGNSGSTVTLSYATGNVSGSSTVGGLAGDNYSSSSISLSYATGNPNGSGYVGGLVGGNASSVVTSSYATGNATGAGWVGGLVGGNNSSGSISSSYATGVAIGSGNGGLVGLNYNASVTSSYALGSNAGITSGGVVGYNTTGGNVTSSYFDTITTGQTVGCRGDVPCAGATGKTTAQMTSQATFAGWDFVSTWKIPATYYPCLLWQAGGTCVGA